MKVIVIGANGMLGYAVSSYYKSLKFNVLEVTRQNFDIAKDPFSKFESIVNEFKPDLVINCAGVIKPMIAKTSIEDVLKVNAIFPHNLGKFYQEYSKQNKSHFFHITTDCVYSGAKGLYTEADYYDATDVYGMSKNAGEPLTLMTLRTSIIGEEKGVGRSLLEWARSQKGKEVNGFENHRWNGVTTVKLAQITHQIATKNLYQAGLFHVHSPDAPTKFELLNYFNQTYDLGLKVNKVNATELCDRTLSSRYDFSKKLVTDTVETQIREMQKFFKEVK